MVKWSAATNIIKIDNSENNNFQSGVELTIEHKTNVPYKINDTLLQSDNQLW